jgi:hypothetical protein
MEFHRRADIVIEAVIENLKIKQDLFAKLDGAAKPACILVTNTSSLPVADIGQKLGAERRKRYALWPPMPHHLESTRAELIYTIYAQIWWPPFLQSCVKHLRLFS